MIKSKEDYYFYLEADRLALGKTRKRPNLFFDDIWKFLILLRKVEYYKNCKKSFFEGVYFYFLYYRLYRSQLKYGFNIPLNCFGPGLSIAHRGTIVVNNGAKIGSNCRIHVNVIIGTEAGYSDRAPTIGNNVYIGPGAKIFGPIFIADGIAIGANSVVNKSFEEPNITIAGVPAKKVSNKGSSALLVEATVSVDN